MQIRLFRANGKTFCYRKCIILVFLMEFFFFFFLTFFVVSSMSYDIYTGFYSTNFCLTDSQTIFRDNYIGKVVTAFKGYTK